MKGNIPYFFFPTTVMLVDDNQKFLTALSFKLPKNMPIKMENNPAAAIDDLAKLSSLHAENNNLIYAAMDDERDDEHDKKTMEIDVSSFSKLIFDKNRFTTISVVTVDYMMPYITGTDFCKKITDHKYLKKIMLTGEADHSIAIDAFNDRIIDKFIVKEADELNANLYKAIKDLQLLYFKDWSDIIESEIFPWEGDDKVESVFRKFLTEHDIYEYYLWDASGTFFCMDATGTPYWFVIKTEGDMQELSDIAQSSNAAPEIQQPINARESLVYFPSEEDFKVDVSEWKSLMHPCKKVSSDKQNYYCSIIQNQSFNINMAEVTSLNAFLDL